MNKQEKKKLVSKRMGDLLKKAERHQEALKKNSNPKSKCLPQEEELNHQGINMETKPVVIVYTWIARVALSLYLLWIGLNLIFFLWGTPSGIYRNEIPHGKWAEGTTPQLTTDVKKVVFPFGIAYYDITKRVIRIQQGYYKDAPAYRVYLPRIKAYDYTEFVFALVAPLLLFFAVRVLIPTDKMINRKPNH